MERTLITKLVEWKERSNRKPLILKGVRQCGKTYLLKEFGKRYYESCAYFVFEENEALKNVFEKGYELDFAKHAPTKAFPKLTAIWRAIPEQLAKENTKFIFSHVKKGWRSKGLEDALEWLIAAGLVYKVCKIEKPFIPLSSYADDTSFKLYMSDVGILRKLSNLPYEVVLDATPTYKESKGSMTENYVLCELLKSVDDTAYYWSSGNTAEVDFIIQIGTEIVPIEVKSEKNVKARSLAEYRKKYTPKYSVKTSMKHETDGEEILNIPLYLVSQMASFMKI